MQLSLLKMRSAVKEAEEDNDTLDQLTRQNIICRAAHGFAQVCSLQNFPHQFATHYISENNIIIKVLLLLTFQIEINKVDDDKGPVSN